MQIVDKFNEVGNRYAVSSRDIGESLRRSASSLHTAGNSMDESIGMIVAMNETIRDAEVTGTALKTISMRLRNTSESLRGMGADAEGAEESVTKLQAKIKDLSGVDIMKDKDNFKSTYQIMTELSKVWDSLTDKTRADLTRLIGGVHQGNTLNAMLTNMATGMKATETSLNSFGSATKENEVYMESIAGKIAEFKASFEALSNTVVGSDFLKGFIEGGTNLVSILDKLVANYGSLALAIITANIAYLAFNAAKSSNILLSLKQIPLNIQASLSLMKEAYAAGAATVATGGFSASVAGLSAAFKSLFLTNPLVVITLLATAVFGATKAVDALTTSTEEHKTKLSDLNSEYDDITTNLQKLQDELKTTSDRIKELEGKGNLTLIEQGELKTLKEANVELQKKINLQNEEKIEAAKSAANESVETFRSADNDYAKSKSVTEAGARDSKTSEYKQQLDIITTLKGKSEELSKTEQNQYDNAIAKLKELNTEYDAILTPLQTLIDLNIKLTPEQQALYDSITKQKTAYENLLAPMNQVVEKQKEFDELFASDKFSGGKKELLDQAKANTLTADSVNQLSEKYPDLKKFMDDTGVSAGGLAQYISTIAGNSDEATEATASLADSISSLKDASDGLKSLNQAFEDFKDKGSVAFSTVADISDKFKDVAGIDGYVSKLYDANLTADELNSTLTDLTYVYINTKMSVEELANATVDQVSSMLKEVGVQNASAVASDMITNAKIRQKIATFDLANATEANKEAFFKEIQAMGLTQSAVDSLRNAFASAQIGMSDSAHAGAQSRLKILQTELANVIAVALAYSKMGSGSLGGMGIGMGVGMGLAQMNFAKDIASLQNIKLDNVPKVSYGGNLKDKKDKKGGDKKDAWKEAFEKEYAELQFLRNTDQISQQQYYDRLEALDKKYFLGKNKYIEEHRKNLEELYKLQKELFDDYVNDIEHEIFILSKKDGTEQQQIAKYIQLQEKVKQTADKYRALGLSDNHELIQGLQKQWWDYADNIAEIQKRVFDDYINDTEHEILIVSRQKGTEDKQIALYRQLLRKLEDQENEFRKRGLDNNSQQIQELVKQQMDYADKIKEIQEKLLQDTVDGYQKKIDNYDKVISAVTDVLDKEIDRLNKEKDALQKNNDEQERAIKLRELEDNLLKARNNKTLRIYHADTDEWVWEADQKAIKDAQKELDDFHFDEKLRGIDEQIKSLEDYKEEWTSVSDHYKKEQDRLMADHILFGDWEKDVLNKRLSTVRNFRDEYNSIMSSLTKSQKDLEDFTNSYQGGTSSGGSFSGSGTGGRYLPVGSDGKAPSDAQIGDIIVTDGGDFKITGTKPDGSWTSEKLSGNSSGSGSNSNIKILDTSDSLKLPNFKDVFTNFANPLKDIVSKTIGNIPNITKSESSTSIKYDFSGMKIEHSGNDFGKLVTSMKQYVQTHK